MLPDKIKPMKEVPEVAHGLDLPKHMAEHIYMFPGESVDVVMLAEKDILTELVDWFGTDFRIMEDKDNMVKIRVRVNPEAMRFWALQYGPYVEVIKPEPLRKQIIEDVTGMAEKYSCQ
jgi:predicted DNA-binding transcriptional regulator YafY